MQQSVPRNRASSSFSSQSVAMFLRETDGKRKNQGLNPVGREVHFSTILSRSNVGPIQMEPLTPEIKQKGISVKFPVPSSAQD
jgi:hypothetical protein